MNTRFEFWKNLLPEVTYTDLVATVLITVAAVFLFSKNIFIDNSVLFQDEYIYKVGGDRLLNQELVLERGLLWSSDPLPNKLFLSLYGMGSYFGSNYYIFAQFLNVIFWALGILALFRIAILSGLSRYASIAYLISIALLPFSSYTKYFMPEAMYFFMFCLSFYAFLFGIQKQKQMALLLSGVIVGLAYFVKPHAVFIVVANVLYIFFIKGQNRLRSIGTFCAGAFLSMILGQYVLFKSSCTSAYLCSYDKVPGKVLAETQFYLGDFWKLLHDFLYVSLGHSMFLFSVFGIVYLLAIAINFPRLRLLRADSIISEPLRLILNYTVLLSIILVSISVLFTLLMRDIGRIHSRYYFFIFPMLMLIIFHFSSIRLGKTGVLLGLIVCFTAALSLAGIIGNYWQYFWITLVSDSPELGFAFFSNRILYLSIMLLMGITLLVMFNPPKYGWLVGTIVALSLLSSANVIGKQKGIFRGAYTTGQESIAVEQIIGREQMNDTLIVGENRDIVTKFLFPLSSTPYIDYLPSGGSVQNSLDKFPESKWLVAISSGYSFSDGLNCFPVGKSITICSVSRGVQNSN